MEAIQILRPLALIPQGIVNSANNIARASAPPDWRQPPLVSLSRIAAVVCAGIGLIICWRAAEIRPTAFFEPGTAAALWAFIRGLFPPDLSLEFVRVVGAAIIR